jgi:succinoglycan biosynthesis transport protein ExoP
MNYSKTKQPRDEGFPQVTLRDMLAPLFRHRRLVLATFCAASVCAILFTWLWASRYYVAKMQVLVEQDRSDPSITTEQSAAMTNNKMLSTDQISSEVALLQGQDMLRSAAATCRLDADWSVFDILLPADPERRKAAKLEGVAIGLSKKIDVEIEKNSDVITVKYGRTGEPETPACVLQTLSKLYLEKHLQLRRPPGSTDFFEQETQKYKEALTSSEIRLKDFSRQSEVAAPDEMRTDLALQIANTEGVVVQTRAAIVADEQRIATVEEQLRSTPARSTTQQTAIAANLLLEQLGTALLNAENKRTQLLLKYDPSYPLVREADEEVVQAQDAITAAQRTTYVNETTDRDPTYELLREDLAKTRADLAAQQGTARALTIGIRNINMQMVDLDAKTVTQAALIRELKADESNYLLYLGKREQQRASDALDQKSIADVAIAVPAVVPALPAHRPILVLFAGLVFAVFLAVAAAFTAEYLDPSFRTPQEVTEILKIPVLASMPKRAA